MVKENSFFEYVKKNKLLHLIELPVLIGEKGHNNLYNIIEQRLCCFINKLAVPYFKSVGYCYSLEEGPIYNNPINQIRVLTEGIKQSIKTKDYVPFKNALDSIGFLEFVPKSSLLSETILFRSRKGNRVHIKDFYHCPFERDNEEKNENVRKYGRFDTTNLVSWYLGMSQEVCAVENEGDNSESCLSIIQFHLKEGYEVNIVDLTSEKIHKGVEEIKESDIVFFPLYLACYCVAEDKEDKEIYMISQYLAQYIHENQDRIGVKGLQYFTVRYKDLFPQETTYKNICLFPEKDNASDEGYDMELMNKFEFEGIQHIEL